MSGCNCPCCKVYGPIREGKLWLGYRALALEGDDGE